MQLAQADYRHQLRWIFTRSHTRFWSGQLRPLLSVADPPTLETVFIHSFGKDAGPLLCKVECLIYSGPFETLTCSIWSWKTFTALISHNFWSGYKQEMLSVAVSPQQKPNERSQYCKQFICTKWKVCNSVSERTMWEWGLEVGGWSETGSGEDGQCLWSMFWWRDAKWVGRRQEQGTWVYSCLRRVILRRGAGAGGVYRKNDSTSFQTSVMTNMNITYKMPYVSTKIYSYLSSTYCMYVQKRNEERNAWGWRGKQGGDLLDAPPSNWRQAKESQERQQPEAGQKHFFGAET